MKAVILAAGKGTRMKELTKNQPKPMLEIGKQRILEQIVLSIHNTGIHNFIVVTGYFANLIEDHFQEGTDYGIHVQYIRQPVQDGTGGALRLTREAVGDEPFFMCFGDIITSIDNYSRIIDGYKQDEPDVVLAVNYMDDPCNGAAVHFDEETRRIHKIIEKPPKGESESNWNNAGLFVFDPCVFSYLDQIGLSPRGEYELTDAIRLMIEDGKTLRAVKLKGFWGDIGRPEDVEYVRGLLKENENLLEKEN